MTRPHGTVAGVAFLAKRWRTFFVVALFGIATLINLLLTIKCRGGETAVSLKKTYKITNGKPWSPFHWNNTADKRASMINRPGSQITSFPPSRWPKRIISTDNPRIDGYVRSTSRVTTPNRTIYEPKDVVYSNAIMNRRSPQIDSIPVSPNKTSEDCVPMKEWHLTSYPTCNTMHETNILSGPINMLAEGTVRSTWKIANYNAREKSQEIILKTLKLRRPKDVSNYQRLERHRRGALASERLSFSPHVVDIYGYCGHSCLNEAMANDLETIFQYSETKKWSGKPSSLYKLRLAADVATALSHVHTADEYVNRSNSSDSMVTMIHRDVTHRNVLLTRGGRAKLNDFNLARFLKYESDTHIPCNFREDMCTNYRSPEECTGKPLTHKIDIYGLGNTMYYILTGHEPYYKYHINAVSNFIKNGIIPKFPANITNSADPAIDVMRSVIHQCLSFDPKNRPSATEVAGLLSGELKRILQKKKRAERKINMMQMKGDKH